jgi:hypothetical protein
MTRMKDNTCFNGDDSYEKLLVQKRADLLTYFRSLQKITSFTDTALLRIGRDVFSIIFSNSSTWPVG